MPRWIFDEDKRPDVSWQMVSIGWRTRIDAFSVAEDWELLQQRIFEQRQFRRDLAEYEQFFLVGVDSG